MESLFCGNKSRLLKDLVSVFDVGGRVSQCWSVLVPQDQFSLDHLSQVLWFIAISLVITNT